MSDTPYTLYGPFPLRTDGAYGVWQTFPDSGLW
jgi:hypothetical protein